MFDLKHKIQKSKWASKCLLCLMMPVYFVLDHLFYRKKQQILFSSFSGKQYSDSPKYIYEALKAHPEFSTYTLKWVFLHPEDYPMIPQAQKVKLNSLSFFIELFTSKVWITNASIERLIPYKSKKITYINTWHGIPLKYIGCDAYDIDWLTNYWYEHMQADLMTACSDYDERIFKHVFPKAKRIEQIGLARNEHLLVKNNIDKVSKKWVVLYAPTFRKDPSSKENMFFDPQFCRLFPDVIFLVRAHYFSTCPSHNMIDVSNEDLEQLLLLADVVVTDYSSLMFDYALLEKPLVLYPYDLSHYKATRGLYLDYETLGLTEVTSKEALRHYFDHLQECYDKEQQKVQRLKAQYHHEQAYQSIDYIIEFLRRQ